MINPISLLLIGPFFEMGNSEMKVHTVGKDHTKQKIVACEVPVIPYQMKYESEDSKQKKQRGPSLVRTLFRHCVVSEISLCCCYCDASSRELNRDAA